MGKKSSVKKATAAALNQKTAHKDPPAIAIALASIQPAEGIRDRQDYAVCNEGRDEKADGRDGQKFTININNHAARNGKTTTLSAFLAAAITLLHLHVSGVRNTYCNLCAFSILALQYNFVHSQNSQQVTDASMNNGAWRFDRLLFAPF